MMVPLDLRLMIFGLEGASRFEGCPSEFTEDKDEALVGEGADGCACACEVVEADMGDGWEADIAAPFMRSSVNSER